MCYKIGKPGSTLTKPIIYVYKIEPHDDIETTFVIYLYKVGKTTLTLKTPEFMSTRLKTPR